MSLCCGGVNCVMSKSYEIVKGHVGLNALRVIAMLMVCLLHMIYPQNPDDDFYNLLMCFMHSVAIAGVNIFVLITGFFLIDKKWTCLRYFRLWYPVAFYTIGIIFLFYVLDRAGISSGYYDFGLARYYIAKIMFGSCYWFFAAYSALYLLIPFLNRAIHRIDKQTLLSLLLVTAGILPIMNMMCFEAIYGGGNVFVWFIVLYLVGAYIRKYPIDVPCLVLLSAIAICIFIPTVLKIVIDSAWVSNAVGGLSSPFVVLYSVSVFVLFSRWKNCKFASIAKILSVMSSLSFGVYLIHVHPFAFKWLLEHVELWYSDWGYCCYVPVVLALSVYSGCSLIEWGRIILFRLSRLDVMLDSISVRLESTCVELFRRVKMFGSGTRES